MVILGLDTTVQLRPEETGCPAVMDNDSAQTIPSYAINMDRLQQTVKQAHRIVKSRDASVAVSRTELHDLLTKIEDLEKQVQALTNRGDASASTSPVLDSKTEPIPSSNKIYDADETGYYNCDAENLLYDLGVRTVVDTDGQVSVHPSFRRNPKCTVEANTKESGKSGDPIDVPKGSELAISTDEAGRINNGRSGSAASKEGNIATFSQNPSEGGENVSQFSSKSGSPTTAEYIPSLPVAEQKFAQTSQAITDEPHDAFPTDDTSLDTDKSDASKIDEVSRYTIQIHVTDTVASFSTATKFISATSKPTIISEPATGASNIGAIIGAVIGCLALVCGCIVALVYLMRRNKPLKPPAFSRQRVGKEAGFRFH
ncbi:hypothetical protein QQS21_004103 [Conoideocrella luteorostrata]|uniref:Uncharacterized protein n=1 Tax=Conoideocrella luteorostrata TaxID=1105319 RepID=A0AAJ0CS64_9HYPO|nr:hypothetical protein QQS21_004103 [Conoideocrella luteorostrata]